MAKRTRRARRISRPRRPVTSQAVKEVNFAEEYQYVVEDLKRIAIIALALLILLIVLALIIG